MMRDLVHKLDIVQSLVPALRTTGTATGSPADLQGYNGAVAEVTAGAWTDGTHTPSLFESADGTTYAAVAAADLQGAFAAIAGTAQQNAIQRVGYIGSKRYIKGMLVSGTSTTGVNSGINIIRGNANSGPLA
jgi:hypothetical protein